MYFLREQFFESSSVNESSDTKSRLENLPDFSRKYVVDFTLKHLLLFEICEMLVYKHSETKEYVKNKPT